MDGLYVFGLCKGRHPQPVTSYLFDTWIRKKPNDFWLYRTVNGKIPGDAKKIVLFKSGHSGAINAVIRVCKDRKIELVIMDRKSDDEDYERKEIMFK